MFLSRTNTYIRNTYIHTNYKQTHIFALQEISALSAKMDDAGISHNIHTTLTLKDVEVQFEQYKQVRLCVFMHGWPAFS